MDIVQNFYDSLSAHYDKLFSDWHSSVREQAAWLDGLFRREGFSRSASILDCACGIGTQAIGLAALGYRVTASDISPSALEQAEARAAGQQATLRFRQADFRTLQDVFPEFFDIIICMDNALPHMLSREDLEKAVQSIVGQLAGGGIFVASIRDYDALLTEKPPYSPPYIHRTEKGRRVSFQTWDWSEDHYKLRQYIIEDEAALHISKFDCEYRAIRRQELSELLLNCGCRSVDWMLPEESGFYQPLVIARK